MDKICKYFGDCGGCSFQDIPYPEQLKAKEAVVRDLMEANYSDLELKPINSGSQMYYRNKMEFTFFQNSKVVCGFYSKKEKRKVLDLEECMIFSPDAVLILKAVKDFVNTRNYKAYDKFIYKGFLRHLIIRETKFSNEIMLGIVTTTATVFDKEAFVKVLLKLSLKSKIKSIYWIKNDSTSDAVVFEDKELLYGVETITERLNGLSFKIGIDTFFQVNPRMLAEFYTKLKDHLNISSEERVLDLFCGVGSIGIFLAKSAKYVWGVELSKEIVDLAWENARDNNIDNISFFVSDARRFLNTQGSFYKDIDVLVINPPRCGLSKRMIRAILRLNPERILYSSCNPKAMFSDLDSLAINYTPQFFEPFDFFPHTRHLEVCSLLKRK
tara:strand:- start:4606 stop:5754 length:1149 start_codon:yes stop_codon:yes gene_type:complete